MKAYYRRVLNTKGLADELNERLSNISNEDLFIDLKNKQCEYLRQCKNDITKIQENDPENLSTVKLQKIILPMLQNCEKILKEKKDKIEENKKNEENKNNQENKKNDNDKKSDNDNVKEDKNSKEEEQKKQKEEQRKNNLKRINEKTEEITYKFFKSYKNKTPLFL